MALIDLTKVDPYGPQVEAQGRALAQRNASLQNVFNQITQGVQRGQARRAAQDAEDRKFRDQEYRMINNETEQLIQANTNNKFTDVQLQQFGQELKNDYYEAIKIYEESDKGPEARQEMEKARQMARASAGTVSGSLDALGAQMDVWREAYKTNSISPATDPAVRQFMMDLNNPETPVDKYQIIRDENTGSLKYVDAETGGENVSFFLDDIANGTNSFKPVEKVEMTNVVGKLMTGIDNITKDGGDGQIVTDWPAIANTINGRMDEMMADDTELKRLAGGLGYTHEEIISMDPNDLKNEMKNELLEQVMLIHPFKAQNIATNERIANTVEEKQAQNKSIVDGLKDQLFVNKDTSYLTNALISRGKPINIGGRNANVATVQLKGNKLLIGGFAGKEQVQEVIDLTNPYESARVAQWMGADYNQAIALMASQEEEVDAGDFK